MTAPTTKRAWKLRKWRRFVTYQFSQMEVVRNKPTEAYLAQYDCDEKTLTVVLVFIHVPYLLLHYIALLHSASFDVAYRMCH